MDSTNPKQTNFPPFGSQIPKKMFRIQLLPETQKSIIARNFIIPFLKAQFPFDLLREPKTIGRIVEFGSLLFGSGIIKFLAMMDFCVSERSCMRNIFLGVCEPNGVKFVCFGFVESIEPACYLVFRCAECRLLKQLLKVSQKNKRFPFDPAENCFCQEKDGLHPK